MKGLALILLLASAVAHAGITSTEQPTVYMILLADDTIEKGKAWPTTEAECLARAKALIPAGSCSIRRKFLNVGDCSDVAKPKWPIEKDADGFVIKPRFKDDGFKPGSDTEYQFQVEDFVPAPYPTCWVKGWRVAELEEINAPAPDEELLANTDEPVYMTPALQAAWDASCAERHAAHVYYEGDECP